MDIIQYDKNFEALLFNLLMDEGDDWSDYHGQAGRSQYIKALESSIAYVAYDGTQVCGYVRCREDDGFGVYVYDLLVRKTHRGKQIGKTLIDQVCKDFKEQPVYVMSDADGYCEKLAYERAGSVLEVRG